MDIDIDQAVDARGLPCPLPILRAKKALAHMQSGQILKVQSTDPGSEQDFTIFAKQTGNALIATEQADGTFVFWLKRR